MQPIKEFKHPCNKNRIYKIRKRDEQDEEI
jgi:hypothetical protein